MFSFLLQAQSPFHLVISYQLYKNHTDDLLSSEYFFGNVTYIHNEANDL